MNRIAFMKRSRRNPLKVAASILLIAAATVAVTLFVTKRTENTNRPKCADLKCYDDSDCGKKCSCDRQAGSAIGNCVAK